MSWLETGAVLDALQIADDHLGFGILGEVHEEFGFAEIGLVEDDECLCVRLCGQKDCCCDERCAHWVAPSGGE